MGIRKPTTTELETILAMSPQAIFDGTLGEIRPTDSKIENLIKPLLEKGGFYFIAEEASRIIGWILLGTAKDPFTDVVNGFVYEIYILKEYRGRGFSKGLMNAAIEHFKKEGYEEVRLSAKAENPAVQIYEKAGFQTRTVSMSLKLN